jgi:hypothetical protein
MKVIKKNLPFIFGCALLFSCNNNSESKKNKIDEKIVDPTETLNADFEGENFSIPSPIQMSLLLKETSALYSKDLLNKFENNSKYSNEYKQALNLGVYGADLGYASINDQNNDAIHCLSAIESLTNKLDLELIFDKSFLTRFDKNKKNQDSVLMLVAEVFRNGDDYLKKINRKHTSSLILTGGWIESMYYACELNKIANNKNIVELICQQQDALNSIIGILSLHNKNGQNNKLIADFKDLKTDFDKISIDYDFKEAKTDEKNKITSPQHSVAYNINDNVMKEITKKILLIRAGIIS